jgi:hypothetical protein
LQRLRRLRLWRGLMDRRLRRLRWRLRQLFAMGSVSGLGLRVLGSLARKIGAPKFAPQSARGSLA